MSIAVPGDRELACEERRVDGFGRRYRVYRGTQCADCWLRERCPESKHGRRLKRYEGEELKEAMAQVSQPGARAKNQRRPRSSNPASPNCASAKASSGFTGADSRQCVLNLPCKFNLKKAVRGALFVLVILWFCFPTRSWRLPGAICLCGPAH
jgi:hypothetical protein